MKNEKTPEELKRAIEKKQWIQRTLKEVEAKINKVGNDIREMRKQRNNNEK